MREQNMKMNRVAKGLLFVPCAALFLAVFGFAVMYLWNWLMPPLFGLKLVSFWQAVGLVVLSKIFFGGFRGHAGRGSHWQHRMMERWGKMTPEEREKFREGMRFRCGNFEPPTDKSTA
jgi:Ca2+/H+ antiporter, TMEM165/GDT1 family